MSNDRTVIALTKKSEKVLDIMLEQSYFRHKMDAAKLALALAIKCEEHLKLDSDEYITKDSRSSTSWNIGSFDDTGEIKDLIKVLLPETQTPYKVVETLIIRGFKIIEEKIDGNAYVDIEDIL